MLPFIKDKLNMPPVKQFIKETMDAYGISREEAKKHYNEMMKDEIYINDEYQVNMRRDVAHGFGEDFKIIHLSIKRTNKDSIHDWRDLQRIKNMLVGEEFEAMEVYPAESRLVDTANQYHLWVFPIGWRFPLGFNERVVSETEALGSRQRPFEEDPDPYLTALYACRLLVEAYSRGGEYGGSVNWEDIDAAHAVALEAVADLDETEAVADDWDHELLGDDFLILQDHDIGNK